MDRIEFTNSADHRKDAALAAFFCDQSSQQDVSVVQQASEQHVLTKVHIAGLEGGAWAARYARRATVTAFGRTIVIAFHMVRTPTRDSSICAFWAKVNLTLYNSNQADLSR